MIARLFNAPLDNKDAEALGVSTIGSSEAIILSVLAAKRRWQSEITYGLNLFTFDGCDLPKMPAVPPESLSKSPTSS
jgi:hypothetical protein